MRPLVVAALLAATPAMAADKVWTPAPVPAVTPVESVTPAARAGDASSPSHDAPLSGQPVGTQATGGTISSNVTPDVATPNLSR